MAERTGLTKDSMASKEVKTNDTEQIREQIEETRLEMGETINEIEERLSLENISEQVSEKVSEKASEMYETAKDTVYDATINKAEKFMKKAGREIKKSGVYETVTENPFPLFLIAIGAGLLVFNGRTNDHRKSGYNDGRRRNLSGYDSETSTIKNAGRKISNTANSAYETAADTVNSVTDQVGDVAGDTVDTVQHYGNKAIKNYEYYIDENPLVVGAVALTVGAIVGLAIPSTEYENELMGETRENLISTAKDTVSEKVEKVKAVAGNTVSKVGEDAVEKAKKVADKAIDTVGDEVRDKGLA